MSLSLDIPKTKSMYGGGYQNGGGEITFEQCMNNFCSSEHLRGENKYMCGNCKKRCEAKKRFSIE